MKKIYTLILSGMFVANVSNAQLLTLTKAFNEPIIGDFETGKAYDSTSAMVNSPGINQLWNFTSLTTSTLGIVTNSYVLPSTAPGYTTSYASATVAKMTSSVSTDFYKAAASQFEWIGSRPSTSLSLTYTNSAIVAQWPVASGYSLTDPYSGSITVNIIGTSTGPWNGVQNVVAAGSGTLQLPGSVTLNNCMQLKTTSAGTGSVTIIIIGAVNFTITNTTYNYYHASQKFPVLSVNYSSTTIKQGTTTPTTSKSSKITINNNVFVGMNEISNSVSSLNIYPNPVSDQFNINLNNENAEQVSVEILNNLGQVVKTSDLGNARGEMNSSVDVKSLPGGIYFVKTTVGNSNSVKKLIIQ